MFALMSRWLDRYRAGQCRQVWTEMTSIGPDLPADKAAAAEAAIVARETMRRARRNVEQLIDQLAGFGFKFEAMPLVDPPSDISSQLDALEADIGILPLSLRHWFEEVGQVNLNGTHPDWAFAYPDPLVVEAPSEYIRSEYEAWVTDRGTEWDRGTAFEIPLAPDYLHKANVSGGMPYGLAIPNPGADGLLLWEPHQTTFVNYLRIAFSMGGMPGWQREPALLEAWALPGAPPPDWLLALGRELEPL
jgi:hypothetical protein